MNTAEKYIEIRAAGMSESRLTQIWGVFNKRTDTKVGVIAWWGAFRKYTFFPERSMLFDASCLIMIAEHLDEVNAQRRIDRKKQKAI